MFALPFIRRRAKGGTGSIPPGTFATLQDVADAISQLIGGAPDVTLDTIAEIAARIIQDEGSLAAVSAAIANKQDRNAKLTALSALALAADKLIYATGANTLAATDLTAFMRSVLAAQDAAGARAAIGAVGQQDYNADKSATADAIAGKQASSAVLDKVAIGYTAGANQVAAPGVSVPGFTWSAGGGYVLAPISFKEAGRKLAMIDASPGSLVPNRAYMPYLYNAGGVLFAAADIMLGAFGQSILTQDLPGDGAMFYADGTGNAYKVISTLYSRSAMQAPSAQAARALHGEKALIVSNYQNFTQVPPNSPTELQWVGVTPVEGFEQANVQIIGGRLTTNQAASIAASAQLTLYTNGPADFSVTLELRDASGANVGNENGAPGQANGAGWKTINIPFRVAFAGSWSLMLPQMPMRSGGNFAQLRLTLTTPAGAANVGVSEYQLKVMQQA